MIPTYAFNSWLNEHIDQYGPPDPPLPQPPCRPTLVSPPQHSRVWVWSDRVWWTEDNRGGTDDGRAARPRSVLSTLSGYLWSYWWNARSICCWCSARCLTFMNVNHLYWLGMLRYIYIDIQVYVNIDGWVWAGAVEIHYSFPKTLNAGETFYHHVRHVGQTTTIDIFPYMSYGRTVCCMVITRSWERAHCCWRAVPL